MTDLLAALADERRHTYRRLVGLSALLHLGLVVLFALRLPGWREERALPPVLTLIPVSQLPGAAKPRPPERAPTPLPEEAKPPPPPEEAKPPPPPKPETQAVVLPKESQKQPEKTTPKREREPAPKEPAQVDLDEFLAELRESEPAAPAAEAKPAAQTLGPSGPGIVVSPEVLAWIKRAKFKVIRAWVLEPGFRTQRLTAELRVDLSASGEVLGVEFTRRSGNPWFDDSVERAIRSASPLPPPPSADEWPFQFTPGDLL